MKSDARSTTACERRALAFKLRKSGHTFQEIGAQLGITGQGAHGIVWRELKRLTKEIEADAVGMRALELERLDALVRATWSKAENGDLAAIDRLLKISKRRSELLGLDAPLKTVKDFFGDQVRICLPDNGRDKTKSTGANDR